VTTSGIFKRNSRDQTIVDINSYYYDRKTFELWEGTDDESDEEGLVPEQDDDKWNIYCDLVNEWKKHFLRIPNYDERANKLELSLLRVEWNDENVPDVLALNKEWADRVHDTALETLKVMDASVESDAPGGKMQKWLDNLRGNRHETDTMIHALMVVCERSVDEDIPSVLIGDGSYIDKIMQNCPSIKRDATFGELSDRQASRFRTSKSVDKGDIARVRDFTNKMRDELADRGVQAKSHNKKRKSDPVIKDKELNPLFNTGPLEDFLCEPFVFNEDESMKNEYDIKEDNNADFVKDLFGKLSKMEIMQALEFRDRVIAEVNANASRNQETDSFIIRKILGFEAFVIIKPTSLGSVNNPKPVFYSVVFKGRSISTLFENVVDPGFGWSYTEFISTSRIRASHEMNSMPQFIMMVSENLETLGSLQEDVDIDSIQNLVEPIKWCLLAHLSDTEEFSAVTSNFRYYYFSLFTGFRNCKNEADRLAEKLPNCVRDPLLLLALKRLISEHESLDSETLSQETSVLSHRKIAEDTAKDATEDHEHDKLPKVNTPFGFPIVNARSFLKAAYSGIYHNKDEAEKGPAAKQITSKLGKQNHHMDKILVSGSSPDKWDKHLDPELGIYEFNARAIILGADLLKSKLLHQRGISMKDYRAGDGFDDWIEKTIVEPTLLRSTYDILASTRSSYVDNGEVSVSKYHEQGGNRKCEYEDDEGNDIVVGETIKCLEAVIELRQKGVTKGMSPSDDLYELFTAFEEEGSKFTVKIFKKNQLTGVREIYILTILGRILQRVLEDLARSICNEIHEEKLTGPETKDGFISEHKSKRSESEDPKKSITLNGSGDKTQWANYLQAKSVTLPLFRLLPKKYHPAVAHIGNANTKKEIEIPAALMESIIDHPATDLEDPTLNEIKNAVLNKNVKSSLASYDSSRLKCMGNTMQGIFHYLSSLLHLCALCLLEQMVRITVAEMGYESIMSFEVSSDDKGFMVSVLIAEDENVNLLRLILKVSKKISQFEKIIDACFGIRDSKLKSVTSISVSFEFNSVFYFGNSISTPIAKFTARCCDDSVQSSLHQRVSSMYSSVRQIRDNGGSGILCSIATMCQHIVMKTNLGFLRFGWFDEDANRTYESIPISHLGYRKICNPFTAGLAMADFENQKVISRMNLGNMYSLVLRQDLDSDEMSERVLKLNQALWSDVQHKQMLTRLGLAQHDVTAEEALLILSRPSSPEDIDKKLELKACSSSLSRSFVQCQRSDLQRAGMYLLWHKAFKWDNEMICYRDLVKNLLDMPRSEYGMREEYLSFQGLERSQRFYSLRSKRLRLLPRYLKPLVSDAYVREDVEQYIRNLWMGEDREMEIHIVEQIKNECTWITDTSDEFFKIYDPEMLHRFINSISTRRSRVKLLCRGSLYATNPIGTMYRDNTCADAICRLTPNTEGSRLIEETERMVKLAAARVSRWCDVLGMTGVDHRLERLAWEDLCEIGRLIPANALDHCETRQQRLCCYILKHMSTGAPISCKRVAQLGTTQNMAVLIEEERREGLRTYFRFSMGHVVRIRRNDSNEVVDLACDNQVILSQVHRFTQYAGANRNDISDDVTFIPERLGIHRGSMSLVDSSHKFTAVYGTQGNADSETHPIQDHGNRFEDVEIDMLNQLFSDGSFSYDSMIMIKESDGPVPRMIRSMLYHGWDAVRYRRIRRTTVDQRDSAMPARQAAETVSRLANLGMSEILEFAKPNPEEVAVEESEENNIMHDFLEVWGENAESTIPGMENDEGAWKNEVDTPKCIRELLVPLKEAVRTRDTARMAAFGNEYLRFFDKIMEENHSEE
jgi:hypothetical protein